MSDDSTNDNWEPLADQPVTPPMWAPPVYGPPPVQQPVQQAAPPPAPPPASWAPPSGSYGGTPYGGTPYGGTPYGSNPYGPGGGVEYLQSPPPRHGHRALIAVIVVALIIAAGITAAAVTAGSHSTKSSVAASSAAPSASAVVPPAPALSHQPSPNGGAQPQASSGPLDGYLLSPSDLGARTLMVLIDGGRSVTDQATLDFCGYHYTSETMRAARVQVEYIGGPQDASNEFVQYKPGGATSAYAEIQKAVDGCPSTYTDKDSQTSQLQHLSNLPGLTKDHVAIEFAVTTTSFDGNPVNEWSTVVYQFDGNYFSGVYVYGTDKARVEQVGAQLAAKAAQHLSEAAVGKPGSGGGTFTDPNAQQGPGAQA